MLFHVPDEASGTLDKSIGLTVDLAGAVGVAIWLAPDETGAEPVAVDPTQPAATSVMTAARAAPVFHLRPLTNVDLTSLPLAGRSSVPDASVTP
jgi:hypothetical protein